MAPYSRRIVDKTIETNSLLVTYDVAQIYGKQRKTRLIFGIVVRYESQITQVRLNHSTFIESYWECRNYKSVATLSKIIYMCVWSS